MKIRFLLLLFLSACTNHDLRKPEKEMALEAACDRCGKTPAEMSWFGGLVVKAESEESWRGDIYAGSLNGSSIFIHQPIIISCMACHVYDCAGNRLTLTSEEIQLAANEMTESNLIYRTEE